MNKRPNLSTVFQEEIDVKVYWPAIQAIQQELETTHRPAVIAAFNAKYDAGLQPSTYNRILRNAEDAFNA